MAEVTFIGYGEAAGAFTNGWSGAHAFRGFDLKIMSDETGLDMTHRIEGDGGMACASRRSALSGAMSVFSTVTADQALAAARECAPYLAKDAMWFDMNSCAPATKKQAASVIEAVGARYVDVAVMAPVYPKQNKVPLLVSGPHGVEGVDRLNTLSMAPKLVEGPVGAASSIKMVRSIMVKGMEALTAECFLAAKRAGVEDAVMESLNASHPQMNWPKQSAYNFERMMVHGIRRAAEMREVVKMLDDLGLPSDLTAGVVDWQQSIGALETGSAEELKTLDHDGLAAKIIDGLNLDRHSEN